MYAADPFEEGQYEEWLPERLSGESDRVQGLLTDKGMHRSAAPVDLLIAATAELQGITLLHRDHDFDCIAAVTGQAMQWYGPESGK